MKKSKAKFRVGQVVFDKEYKIYVRVDSVPDEDEWVKMSDGTHMQESTLRSLNKREKGE